MKISNEITTGYDFANWFVDNYGSQHLSFSMLQEIFDNEILFEKNGTYDASAIADILRFDTYEYVNGEDGHSDYYPDIYDFMSDYCMNNETTENFDEEQFVKDDCYKKDVVYNLVAKENFYVATNGNILVMS